MSENSGNSVYKNLFLLSAMVAVIAMALFIWQSVQTRKMKSVFGSEVHALNQLESEIAFLSKLNKADAQFILEENFEQALQSYNELLQSADEKHADALEKRVAQIKSLQKQQNNSTNEFEKLYRESKQRLSELEKEIKAAKTTGQSGEAELKKKIEILTAEIAQKNKELSRKQLVQTISFKNENGHAIHYLGEVVNGKANGGGVGIWSTGSIYRGDWKDNKRHGKGEFEWAVGEKYTGEYRNDKRHGEGTYYWPSGERYEGEWKDDRRDGIGILYDQDGNTRFEGAWKDDKPQK